MNTYFAGKPVIVNRMAAQALLGAFLVFAAPACNLGQSDAPEDTSSAADQSATVDALDNSTPDPADQSSLDDTATLDDVAAGGSDAPDLATQEVDSGEVAQEPLCDPTLSWCPTGPFARVHDHDWKFWSPAPGVVWVYTFRGWVTRVTSQGAEPLRQGDATQGQMALWGSSEADVWLGGIGSLEHWDGSTWTSGWLDGVAGLPALVRITAIRGRTANDVWAVGQSGLLLHWNGTAWSSESLELPWAFHDVLPTAEGDVWAVGEGAAGSDSPAGEAIVFRRHEGTWNEVSLDQPYGTSLAGGFSSLAQAADGALWFAGPVEQNPCPGGAVGIYRYQEGRFELMRSSDAESQPWAVTASPSGKVWIYGWDSVLQWTEGQWQPLENTPDFQFGYMQADESDGLWALVGDYTLARWDSSAWTVPYVAAPRILASTVDSQGRVWAAGAHGVIVSYINSQWRQEESGVACDLRGIWAAGEQVWAVGGRGVVLQHSDESWASLPSPGDRRLVDVWATSPNDVWVVASEEEGMYGEVIEPLPGVFHWDGGQWSDETPPTGAILTSIAGDGQGAIYVAGFDGAIYKRSDDGWSLLVESPTAQYTFTRFYSLFVDAQGVLWASGEVPSSGFMSRWQGQSLQVWKTNRTNYVQDIWSDGSGHTYAVGQGMEIFELENDTWSLLEVADSICMHTVTGLANGTAWALGDDGWIYGHTVAE